MTAAIITFMKKTFRILGLMLCTILISIGFTACGDDDNEPGSNSIVGTWRLSLQEEDGIMWHCQYEFSSNGSLKVKDWTGNNEPANYEATGNYSTSADVLTLTITADGESWTEQYKFKIEGNHLIIYDYEEDGPNTFVKIK